jgi:hypothetical protein
MATLIYNNTGALVDIHQGTQDAAVFNGQTVPFITGSQLQRYAAVVYSEGSYVNLARQINPVNPVREMERESFGIAVTMYNFTRAKNAALKPKGQVYGLNELLQDSSYTKGINSPKFNEYFSGAGEETRRRIATLSVIKLFTRQFADMQDVVTALQGASYWDGNDLFRRYRDHYRAQQGFQLGMAAHGRIYERVSTITGVQVINSCPAQNPTVAAKRQYTFLSTFTAAGTIFFRLHPQATAQGITW